MANPNKTKLIGLILVLAAIGALAFIFMKANLAPQKASSITQQEMSEMKAQIDKLAQENASMRNKMATTEKAVLGPVKLDNLVQKAQSIYGDSEKDRQTGYLWIDRKSENFIVTLGALNGLQQGSHLSVYDGDRIIDSVTVDMPFDIVSFVKPNNSIDQFSKDYYRVVAEN